MDVQDIVAWLLAAGALAFVVRSVRRALSRPGGCGCSTGASCPPSARTADARRTLQRLPLVQVGKAGASSAPPGKTPADPSASERS